MCVQDYRLYEDVNNIINIGDIKYVTFTTLQAEHLKPNVCKMYRNKLYVNSYR